jgi:hypothetical protein
MKQRQKSFPTLTDALIDLYQSLKPIKVIPIKLDRFNNIQRRRNRKFENNKPIYCHRLYKMLNRYKN